MKTNNGKNSGVTLIEVMIVVAIIAILASIAYPSYQAYIVKARRRDAQDQLMLLSQKMEKYHAVYLTYATASLPTLFPEYVPADAASPNYKLHINYQDKISYIIQARPVIGNKMEGDACGYLEYNSSTGNKRALLPPLQTPVAGCWK